MRRGNTLFAIISVLLAGLGLLACEGTSEEEVKAAQDAEEWAWLEQAKAELDGKRQELADLQNRLAEGVGEDAGEEAEPEAAEGEGAEGEGAEAEAPPTAEELSAQAEALQEEVYSLADAFSGRLIQYINNQQIGVNSEPTEIQRKALSMKSDEDIVLAQEYITKGGEYQRAIDIYSQALAFDPDNEKLAAAKAHAEELRYITEERLAGVKKNMTEKEVLDLLGTPKTTNVREFDNGVIGWFYPKAEPRTAAAVFFQPEKGELKVYRTDFEAVKASE